MLEQRVEDLLEEVHAFTRELRKADQALSTTRTLLAAAEKDRAALDRRRIELEGRVTKANLEVTEIEARLELARYVARTSADTSYAAVERLQLVQRVVDEARLLAERIKVTMPTMTAGLRAALDALDAKIASRS